MSFENQIKEILKARLEGTATEEELAILREWLDRSPQNRELAELLEESAENLPLLGRIYGYDEQRVWGNIRKAARRRRMRMLAATARKYAAAAAVAALLAGGGWWTLGRRAERLARQAYIEQLTPGVRGAVLTLSSKRAGGGCSSNRTARASRSPARSWPTTRWRPSRRFR